MLDKDNIKEHFKNVLAQKKAQSINKFAIEQSLLTIREEHAAEMGFRKDGELEINKVPKAILVAAINIHEGITEKDTTTEKFEMFEEYKENLLDGKFNKEEIQRYVDNVELKKEVSSTLKLAKDEAKDNIDEDYLSAFYQLVDIEAKRAEAELKEEFDKENGIEPKEEKAPPNAANYDSLKELAQMLGIKIPGGIP
ncbi:MAG: hypothetical protein U9O87_02330 [Verrucomicrobiota bacterium]|nr:hypothetical protein [Verrucomicrobiota bacterium]